MARAPKTTAPHTTAQRLDSIVRSARKIMRKDKGLNGDLDRLPMLTWIMFLKFLDEPGASARGEEVKDAFPLGKPCRLGPAIGSNCRPIAPAIRRFDGCLKSVAPLSASTGERARVRCRFQRCRELRLLRALKLQIIEELEEHDPSEHRQPVEVAIQPLVLAHDVARGFQE